MGTPIEELHEAVARYVEQVTDADGVVSGFVLEYELTSFTDEDGVDARITSTDYATGPGTTLATAVGLTRMLQRALDDAADAGLNGRVE
jgi:hypothetical protein